MICNMKDLKDWARKSGHKIERWKTDNKSCYRIRLWVGTDYEIISAQYFYWVLYRIAGAMEASNNGC